MQTPLARPSIKRSKGWYRQERNDLEVAFRLYNPVTDEEWESLTSVLPNDRTVDEVRAQAIKQKLEVVAMSPKRLKKSTKLIEELHRCMPNGKLPNKGTIKREEFEFAILDLINKQPDNLAIDGAVSSTSFNDSDEAVYKEAIRTFAFQKPSTSVRLNQYKTPSQRTFYPRLVSRRRSSLDRIEETGDDFSIPDRSKQFKFRHEYRARQLNRRLNGSTAKPPADSDEDDTDQFITSL